MLGLAAIPTAVAFTALLGLGLHRHATSGMLSLSATVLLFGPPLFAAGVARERRVRLFAGSLTLWALLLLAGLPVYFPGERRQAVATGLSILGLGAESWESVARDVAKRLPEEPTLSRPEVPLAVAVVPPPPVETVPLRDDQIALPFEGEGRQLSVPVDFVHGERTSETWMMLDTGATYTTLPTTVLRELGIHVGADAPTLTLHTANGERTARVVLLDEVWLGDLRLKDVAVATCDECASGVNVGLLGLNVTGGYNLYIDSDNREVVFTERPGYHQRLDVHPFIDLNAEFTRFPGGRVEVDVSLKNLSDRPISKAVARVECAELSWLVSMHDIAPGVLHNESKRLPEHEPCSTYRIALDTALW